MRLARTGTLSLLLGLVALTGLGAAPPTPSYIAVDRGIADIRARWAQPGAVADPNAPGWNAFFDAITNDLRAYSNAQSEDDRLRALGRLYQMWGALNAVSWEPIVPVRDGLRNWLTPRVTLAWAVRSVTEAVRGLPTAADPNAAANRERWLQFVGNDLGGALRSYESAESVGNRLQALRRLNAALGSLKQGNSAAVWGPAASLQKALATLFEQPNVDAKAGVELVRPFLEHDVAVTGPIHRAGQVSYATAGPRTGFGLMPSDAGVTFFNSQMISTVTPIRGFQQQVASDPKGRRAAKLYQFGATSADSGQVSVVGIISPNGLKLYPSATHNICADVTSAPQPGKGFGRAIASLIGMGQGKITQRVYEGAIGQIRQGIITNSRDEANERSAAEEARENARLRQFLLGGNTVMVRNFILNDVLMWSRPAFAAFRGLLRWNQADEQIGADFPKPFESEPPADGVAADVHIGSLGSNVMQGFFRTPAAQSFQNVMIVTKKVPPGTPAQQAVTTQKNVDFATYSKAVEDTRAANDPAVTAIRIHRPGRAPLFSADRNGFLVALVRDFTIDVPAPPAAARGGIAGPPARIYRLVAPNAEFQLSLHFVQPDPAQPMRVQGRVEGFDAGPGAKVLAIMEDETKPAELTRFSGAIVLAAVANRLKGRPFDEPLPVGAIPNMQVVSVSDLHPTGWMRVMLRRTGRATTTPGAAPAAATAAVAPPSVPAATPAAAPSTVPATAAAGSTATAAAAP